MRWHRVLLTLLQFTLAAGFSGANVWFTAARSTIPLALDTTILSKEVRREKHAGQDDVLLLELEGVGQIQVDREIYESVTIGETLKKERNSHELHHGSQLVSLQWSRDHQGMLAAMPFCWGILAVLLTAALLRTPSPPRTGAEVCGPSPSATR